MTIRDEQLACVRETQAKLREQEIARLRANIAVWEQHRANWQRLARLNPGHAEQHVAKARPLTNSIAWAEQRLRELNAD